jgi:hypothetical protein
MLKSKGLWSLIMLIILAGWGFVLSGLAKPIENRLLKKIHRQMLLIMTLGHALEIPVGLAIGRAAGLPVLRIILKTLVFGFTWWLPLRMGVLKK